MLILDLLFLLTFGLLLLLQAPWLAFADPWPVAVVEPLVVALADPLPAAVAPAHAAPLFFAVAAALADPLPAAVAALPYPFLVVVSVLADHFPVAALADPLLAVVAPFERRSEQRFPRIRNRTPVTTVLIIVLKLNLFILWSPLLTGLRHFPPGRQQERGGENRGWRSDGFFTARQDLYALACRRFFTFWS